MNNNSLGTKLLMAAITLALVVYFGLQGLQYFSDPLSTTMAYAYQVEESIHLSGFVIRDERVLPAESSGLLQLQREEGERISKGGTVARVYTDEASLTRQTEIETLNERIEQLQYAQEAGRAVEAAQILNNQIRQSIQAHQTALAAGDLYAAEKQSSTLRSQILKQDYASSHTEDLSAQIAELQAQRKSLQSQAVGSIRRISAPQAGLYSAVVDGYETLLTPNTLAELQPSTLSAMKPDTQVQSNVGKLILGEKWYYAAITTTETAEQLRDASADLQAKGGSLTIRFNKDIGRDLEVKIASISPSENGRTVVVFESDRYLPQLTLLRQQSAQVFFSTTEGIRIPKEALRIVTTTQTNEDGTSQEFRTAGVYCVVGVEARFKPVEVLHSGDHFILVEPTPPAGKEMLRLRLGDEVIITAKDLYDGKVVG